MELNTNHPFDTYSKEKIIEFKTRFSAIEQEISKFLLVLLESFDSRKTVTSKDAEQQSVVEFIHFPVQLHMQGYGSKLYFINILESVFNSLPNYQFGDILTAHEHLKKHYLNGEQKTDSLPAWEINGYVIYRSVVTYLEYLKTPDAPSKQHEKTSRPRGKKTNVQLGLAEKVLLLKQFGLFDHPNMTRLNIKERGMLLSLLLDGNKDNLEEMVRGIENNGHFDKRYDVVKRQTVENVREALLCNGLERIILPEKE
jgi:hypothetical protein